MPLGFGNKIISGGLDKGNDYVNKGEKYFNDKVDNAFAKDGQQYGDLDSVISKNEQRDLTAEISFEPEFSEENTPSQNNDYKNPLLNSYKEVEDSNLDLGDGQVIKGSRSMFNPMALLAFHRGDPMNKVTDYYDTDGRSKFFKDSDEQLTVEKIVNSFTPTNFPHKPYYYADFAFLKYYGKIPENRLITVRRYPFPTFDSLEFSGNKKPKPIAQAVSYFGNPTNNTLAELLGVKGKIAWKDLTAEFQDIKGNEQGFEDSPFGTKGAIGTVLKGLSALSKDSDVSQRRSRQLEYERTFHWENRIRGKVDVIKKTHIRDNGVEAGVGEYSIEFEYEMRSFNGVNGKIAMLDLMFNFLSLAYTNADFWGGSIRYYPNSPRYTFLGGNAGREAFYAGRYGDYMKAIAGELTSAMGTIGDAFGGIIHGLLAGDLGQVTDTFKKIGGGGLDLLSGRNRPQIIGFKALLSGEPVGNYHMTIGNPFNPIAMIGNLICTDWSFELGEELGADDFPTSFKFTLGLKDGMPRDSSGIQSMFNNGNGKAYLSPKKFLELVGGNPDTAEITEEDVQRASGSVYTIDF